MLLWASGRHSQAAAAQSPTQSTVEPQLSRVLAPADGANLGQNCSKGRQVSAVGFLDRNIGAAHWAEVGLFPQGKEETSSGWQWIGFKGILKFRLDLKENFFTKGCRAQGVVAESPSLEGFNSRVHVALGDTGSWWPWQCWDILMIPHKLSVIPWRASNFPRDAFPCPHTPSPFPGGLRPASCCSQIAPRDPLGKDLLCSFSPPHPQ